MAAIYTFDDVQKAIADNGLFFSDADLKLAQTNPDAGMSIVNYKLDHKNATTDDQRAMANAGAESVRKDFGGYTAGSDGSKYYLTEPSPQSYNYQQPGAGEAPQSSAPQSSAPQFSDFSNPYADQQKAALDAVLNRQEYSNPYADQQKAALDAVLNREAFTYDPNQDAAWQSAKKMYLREADRAQQDMMGQAAGLTGGMASTAAMTAASQAGDYYRGQMNDALGDYQQMAYQRYMDDINKDYNRLNALNTMSDSDYQRFVDSLGLKYDDLSVLNSLSQQARNEYDTDRNFGYNQWLDELSYQTDKENTQYDREQQKEQQEYERSQYKTEYGDALSFDLYNSLMTDYEATGNSDALKRARAILEAIEKQNS